ncbi:MAG TPA: c-type cytochrome biogenesis protein CcmI [Devosia sp.]
MFWIFAIAITAIACATLYYAAMGRRVNATPAGVDDATTAHFRLQLKEIEADIGAGRLGEAEAVAAKGELARELIRSQGEERKAAAGGQAWLMPLALVATALLAFGAYSFLGHPDLPALPLAERTQPAEINLDDAIARIEAQLQKTPDDIRGWTVIAPVYMQQGRFADAANAYRRVIALGAPTADLETNLGEALMMQNGGSVEGEPLKLFESAAARDPKHVRSRFYIASELTRGSRYEEAVAQWNELIALGTPTDAWMETAKAGLAAATDGLNNVPQDIPPDDAAIRGMVDGLAARLYESGGSIEEWTRLVRSRLVLGETALAQADYDKARIAYPDPAGRQELDVLAADNGLQSSKESK